ncbi:50S ribosome-binding GTPase [candidate division WOR-3 bacterium]|nr:50S ribosome-binding GTPase [candidate division WOR-3 bacterium]
MNLFDTIISRITPDGESAVASVRMSGEKSLTCVLQLTGRKFFTPRKATLVKLKLDQGISDQAVVVYYPGVNSYTGEDVCEVSVHGNQYLVKKLIGNCIEKGLRTAEKGEFTYRAFLNGKMDLAQAEGVLAMIKASNENSLRRAGSALSGKAGEKVKKIIENLNECRAELEISTFGEDVRPLLSPAFLENFRKIKEDIETVSRWSASAARDLVKPQIFIVGPPNAGKSTLFNMLYGSKRVVVSDQPGTTRDMIREEVYLPKGSVVLVDGVGIREKGSDLIERQGKDIFLEKLKEADAVIMLLNAESDWRDDFALFSSFSEKIKTVVALNKCDLGISPVEVPDEIIKLSAKTGLNLECLKSILSEKLWPEPQKDDISEQDAYFSERSYLLIGESLKSCEKAGNFIEEDLWDIAAFELENVSKNLGRIVGIHEKPGEIVGLFDKFCVGK